MVLPVVLVMALGLATIAVAVRDELAVQLAAREGARAAAVSADPARAATAAATRAVSLPIVVSTSTDGVTVTVTVTYDDPVDIAIIGAAIGPVRHRSSVTMAIEPP